MTTLPPLATPADLAAHLGETIADDDPRALRLLRSASGAVRAAAGFQQFSRVDDDVVVLRGGGPRLVLPQRPVIDVTAVYGLTDDKWAWDGASVLSLVSLDWWSAAVQVTYSHGYDTIPDDVVGIVLNVAARAWVNPEQLRSDTLDGEGRNFTPTTLLPDEKTALRAYAW